MQYVRIWAVDSQMIHLYLAIMRLKHENCVHQITEEKCFN